MFSVYKVPPHTLPRLCSSGIVRRTMTNEDEQWRTKTNKDEQWRTMTNNDEQWRGNVWSYLVHVRQGSSDEQWRTRTNNDEQRRTKTNYDEQRRTMTNNGEQWRTMTNNDDVMCGGGGPNISKLWSVHYMKCPPNHNWCRINCSVLMDTIWNTFFVSTWHIVF